MRLERAAGDYLDRAKPHPVDTLEKPDWSTGPDGKPVKIAGDVRFVQLFTEWQTDRCGHERTGIVCWVNGGSQTCFNWFCGDCGYKLSSNIPHELAKAHGCVKVTLDELASRSKSYVSERQERLDRMKAAAAERSQPSNRQDYSDYLRSPRYRELRERVMRRANGLCEGCLNAPAEQVHHLTYEHVGSEFAFELRALCERCHHRLHEVREAAE